jgi:L-gulonolactone oxidase
MGDIAYQSIAGATSTATHGTGTQFGNISSRIVALRLVTADGSIIDCSADENRDVFEVARVGLGALGILSTVTLQCVPAFRVHAVEEAIPVDDVLADFDGFMDSADHVEFYWVPKTRWALTKRNRRTDEPIAARGRAKEFIDDIVVSNGAFGLMCRRFPDWRRRCRRPPMWSTPTAATRCSRVRGSCTSTKWNTPSRVKRFPKH